MIYYERLFNENATNIVSLFSLGGGTLVSAKEPTNWMFGFGIGGGKSTIERKYSDSASMNFIQTYWVPLSRSTSNTVTDWGVAWELLAGYKHWLNDWVGFRYYANVGAQHYKDDIFTAGKVKAGVVEYTANADILLNFYNRERFTFGILGGFGIGGAYFDSPALKTYERQWGPSSSNPTNFADRASYGNMGEIKKHHLSAHLSIGVRFNIFHKIRKVSARTCNAREDGRRVCKVPISYLEHSIELNAKFNMLTYYPTKYGELVGVKQANIEQYAGSVPRPGYEIKNPHKITLRYIIAF